MLYKYGYREVLGIQKSGKGGRERLTKHLLLGVVEVHGFLLLVVSCHLEGHDLQGDESRRHGEHLGPMGGFVQVLARVRVRHAGGVATHNVEVGPGNHAGTAVPLHLGGGGERETI